LVKVVMAEQVLLTDTQAVVAVDLVEAVAVATAILAELELVLLQVALLHPIHGAAILVLSTHIKTSTLFHLILLAAEQLGPMVTLVLMP
jgi:hypothetical protein